MILSVAAPIHWCHSEIRHGLSALSREGEFIRDHSHAIAQERSAKGESACGESSTGRNSHRIFKGYRACEEFREKAGCRSSQGSAADARPRLTLAATAGEAAEFLRGLVGLQRPNSHALRQI